MVILNGDIIDIWQFSKSYWPKSHMKIIRQLMNWMSKGIKIHYITGNHDELLRKFEGFKLGSFRIANKLVLTLPDSKTAWFFHGDVFDVTMQHSRWLAKLGAVGYDTLILINRIANYISQRILHKGKLSFSKRIKDSVKSAVKFINQFEQTAGDIAIQNKYDYVVCGHIHEPVIKTIDNPHGKVTYMNSGDWIENCTALEYVEGEWRLYKFNKDEMMHTSGLKVEEIESELTTSQLFDNMLGEFNLMRTS